jgi:hypothetical protein
MMAVLISNSVQIVSSSGNEMKTIQTLSKKVHSFCINNAVFKQQTAGGETLTKDQLCVVTTDKQMFFYDMQIGPTGFKFEEDKNSYMIANRPIHLFWDDNLIYMATKKAYIIMSKDSGKVLTSIGHDPKLNAPHMAMSKTKCLALV